MIQVQYSRERLHSVEVYYRICHTVILIHQPLASVIPSLEMAYFSVNNHSNHGIVIIQRKFLLSFICDAPFFFPGLFFYVYIESSNPKNPEGPTPQAPNPIN